MVLKQSECQKQSGFTIIRQFQETNQFRIDFGISVKAEMSLTTKHGYTTEVIANAMHTLMCVHP